MATAFVLSVGYLSGSTFEGDESDAYKAMEACCKHFIGDGRFAEQMRLRWGDESKGERVIEYVEIYKAQNFNPIFYRNAANEILISCSGGGESRRLKELAAMMLCAHVVTEMALQGIPVSLQVS